MNENYKPGTIESNDIPKPVEREVFSDRESMAERQSAAKKIERAVQERNDRQLGKRRAIEADSGLPSGIREKIAADMSLDEELEKISKKRKKMGEKAVALILAGLSFLPAGMKPSEAYAQDSPIKNERISDINRPAGIKEIDEELERISKISDDAAKQERLVQNILDDFKKSKNPMHGMSEKQQLQSLKKEMESAAFMKKLYDLVNSDRRIMNSNIEAFARGLSSMFGIDESKTEEIVRGAFKDIETKGLFVRDNRHGQVSSSMIEETDREEAMRGKKSVGINILDKKF